MTTPKWMLTTTRRLLCVTGRAEAASASRRLMVVSISAIAPGWCYGERCWNKPAQAGFLARHLLLDAAAPLPGSGPSSTRIWSRYRSSQHRLNFSSTAASRISSAWQLRRQLVMRLLRRRRCARCRQAAGPSARSALHHRSVECLHLRRLDLSVQSVLAGWAFRGCRPRSLP